MGSASYQRDRLGHVTVYNRLRELATGGEGLVARITLSDSDVYFHFWLNSVIGI